MAYVEENLVKNQSTSFHDKEVLSFNNKLKSNVIEVGSINDVQEPGSSASSDLTARTGNAQPCILFVAILTDPFFFFKTPWVDKMQKRALLNCLLLQRKKALTVATDGLLFLEPLLSKSQVLALCLAGKYSWLLLNVRLLILYLSFSVIRGKSTMKRYVLHIRA